MEKKSLKNVLGSFVDSYARRDKAIAFPDWLAGRLRQEMPDMSEEAGKSLAKEIMEAVADYSRTLNQLNAAVDAGQSKEDWFAEHLAETYAGMPDDAVGEKLQQLEDDLYASNEKLMYEIDPAQTEDADIMNVDKIVWDKYNIKDKVYKIGEHITLSGLTVAANVVNSKTRKGEGAEISDVVAKALRDGLKEDSEEVKAVVAGAVKAAAKDGLTDIQDETIGDVAGVAVESAEALYDLACGKSKKRNAWDRIGKASLAAGARYCARALKGFISRTPAGTIGVLVGTLVNYMKSPEFTEDVYPAVREVAANVWKGIKKVGEKIFGKAGKKQGQKLTV